MKNTPALFTVLFLIGVFLLPTHVFALEIAVAGTPIDTVQDKNYHRLFKKLRANGISTYFPTFQFQEVPKPKSLGFETDFIAPCSPDNPAFKALRETGMKLLVPGEFIYPDPRKIGRVPLEQDPLALLISCAGRAAIAGITTYDEAILQGVSLDAVAAFYTRVKKIDPSLPVLMVHAPIVTDKPEFRDERLISKYLETVRAYSAHADIVGFDVYPIPQLIAKLATPMSSGAIVAEDRIVPEYLSWLDKVVPQKRKLIVLQGFSYANLYERQLYEDNVPPTLRPIINPPTQAEIQMMFNQARMAKADMVVFWGTSFLPDHNTSPWPQILELSRKQGL